MILNVADLYLSFGRTAVLQGFGFDLEAGEIACLLGHSGCGKTTALRAVAGFEQPERGRIALQGRTLSDGRLFVPPHLRRIGMVFQDYALFPHLNVADNIAFGLSGRSAEARKARVAELLALIAPAFRRPATARGAGACARAQARACATRRAFFQPRCRFAHPFI